MEAAVPVNPTLSGPSIDNARRWLAGAIGPCAPRPPRIASVRQGWGRLRHGRSVMGWPLCLHGRTIATGLGTHADSLITVTGGRGMRRFQAVVGVDDNVCTRSSTRARLFFTVSVGSRELWRSPLLTRDDAPVTIDLGLPAGATEIALGVGSEGGNAYGHADWAEAAVTWEDGDRSLLGVDPASTPAGPPIAFRYGGRDSTELLPGWVRSVGAMQEHAGLSVQPVTWRDPVSSLEARLEMRSSAEFPTVEWALSLRNGGSADSDIIEDIQSLAMAWTSDPEAQLHRSAGSPCRIDDFVHRSQALPIGANERMGGGGGRSSNDWLPFFNLQTGDTGIIVGIGWTGQWAAAIDHCDDGTLALRAGLEKTRLRLRPGEEIRLPSILLLFWDGWRIDAHNALRRYILAHHTPHPQGRRIEGPLTVSHWGGMPTSGHLARIATYAKAGLDYDHYWIDAGWYGPADSHSPDEHTGDWARHVGNWQVNPKAHPQGLRVISDAAKQAGMDFLLWFEPERAIFGTPLTLEHPEWFLGEHRPGSTVLFDLGNPEAQAWLTAFIGDRIAEHGVGLYRQDFNMDPLGYWRDADAPDRQVGSPGTELEFAL